MQTRTCSSILGFLLLSLSLFLSPAYAEPFTLNELPQTFTLEKKDGKLYTKGFYPTPKPIFQQNIHSRKSFLYSLDSLHTLSQNWDFSIPFPDIQPVFKLIVLNNGQLGETWILRSSGNTQKDATILSGLKKAFPLKSYDNEIGHNSINLVLSPQSAQYYKFHGNQSDIDQQNEEYKTAIYDWVNNIHTVIRQKWLYNSTPGNKAAQLNASYKITTDTDTGEILDFYLLHSSGDKIYDLSTLEALKRLTTLPKISKPLPQRILSIEFTFHSFTAPMIR